MTRSRSYRVRKASTRTAASMLIMMAGQLIVGPAVADDGPFRCGSKIIYNGMMQAEVYRYCGEPTSKSTELREVRSDKNRVLSTTEINRWFYDSYGATRVLVFLDYKLQSIQRL